MSKERCSNQLFVTIAPAGLLHNHREKAAYSFIETVGEMLPLLDEQSPAVVALSFAERLTRGMRLLKWPHIAKPCGFYGAGP